MQAPTHNSNDARENNLITSSHSDTEYSVYIYVRVGLYDLKYFVYFKENVKIKIQEEGNETKEEK